MIQDRAQLGNMRREHARLGAATIGLPVAVKLLVRELVHVVACVAHCGRVLVVDGGGGVIVKGTVNSR